MNYEEVLARRRGGGRRPVQETLIISALEEGEVHEFDVSGGPRELDRIRKCVTNPQGYVKKNFPDRQFATAVEGTVLYVARLKPEDMNGDAK